jgi:forkhead box protein K
MERCSDAKRKGFFWSVDEKFQQSFEEQEARSQVGNLQDNEGGKDGRSSKKKGKASVSILQPALKRSVKMDSKGGPLPPPLTSTPLVPKSSAAFGSAQLLSSSFPTGSAQFNTHSILPATLNSSTSASTSSAGPTNGTSADTQSTSIPSLPPSLYIPIVVGPIPASHSSSSLATDLNNTNPLASTAIVLHESTLILNPEVFSHLTPEQVKELEGLGAQKALEILQGYIARFLKEQRLKKREGVRGRGRGRGAPKRGRGGGRTSDGTSTINESSSIDASANEKSTLGNSTLFTTTPLPLRDVQPQGNASNGSAQSVHPPVDVTEPTSVDTKPPVPVPMADTGVMAVDDSADPIVIVDDSDSSEAPATKRRKLDVPSVS